MINFLDVRVYAYDPKEGACSKLIDCFTSDKDRVMDVLKRRYEEDYSHSNSRELQIFISKD